MSAGSDASAGAVTGAMARALRQDIQRAASHIIASLEQPDDAAREGAPRHRYTFSPTRQTRGPYRAQLHVVRAAPDPRAWRFTIDSVVPLDAADARALPACHAHAIALAANLYAALHVQTQPLSSADLITLAQRLRDRDSALREAAQLFLHAAAQGMLARLREIDPRRVAGVEPEAVLTVMHIVQLGEQLRVLLRGEAQDDPEDIRVELTRTLGEEHMEILRDPFTWLTLIIFSALFTTVWRARRNPEREETRAVGRDPEAPALEVESMAAAAVARPPLHKKSQKTRLLIAWRDAAWREDADTLTETIAERIIDDWSALAVMTPEACALFLADPETHSTTGDGVGGEAEDADDAEATWFLIGELREERGALAHITDTIRSDDEDALLDLASEGATPFALHRATLDALTRHNFRFR